MTLWLGFLYQLWFIVVLKTILYKQPNINIDWSTDWLFAGEREILAFLDTISHSYVIKNANCDKKV